jgi:hypothetical protein
MNYPTVKELEHAKAIGVTILSADANWMRVCSVNDPCKIGFWQRSAFLTTFAPFPSREIVNGRWVEV